MNMKTAVALSAFLICIFFLPAAAQTKERKIFDDFDIAASESKPAAPRENEAGVWNEFSSDKYGFTITFPAWRSGVAAESVNKLISFEARTERAFYGLTVKNLRVGLNNSQLEKLFDEIIGETQNEATKIIAERDVLLNGSLGREIVYEEADKIVFGRFYILESKLFILTVTVGKNDYDKNFDRWAFKFFDSFGVKSNVKLDA
jgi:hypothetical protein